jgi:hypothetical protein
VKTQESIRIQGRDIPFTRRTVSIDAIDLDPKNPRVQYLVGQRATGVGQQELHDLIWAKDSVKALAESIFQNGGVYEPLILQMNGNRFVAREGNCRTVADRHLAQEHPDDARFAMVPAMVFDGELTDEDLAVLLADMHVAGKIRWDAYEQAKHVWDLHNRYHKPFDWLASHLRLSRSKIQELLFAHKAATEFLGAHPQPGNVRKFSFFHEVAKKKALRELFEVDPSFKQVFQKWVAEERLTDAKQVRDLPIILANPEAAKSLATKGYAEAQRVLVRVDPSLESNLFAAIKNATDKLVAIPANELGELKTNPQKLILLRNLHRSIQDVTTLAGVTL